MKKIIIAILISMGILLTGCKNDNKKEQKIEKIVIGTGSRIKKMDPMVSNDIPSLLVTNQIFETFMYYGKDGINSTIIEEFYFENGNLILIPKNDLKFSNGDTVRIEDFKRSLERTLENPGCKFLTGNIKNVMIDEDKLVVSFKVPTPAILNNMTYPMVVLLKEVNGELIGTGSFKLEKEEGDFIELSPNEYSKNPGKINIVFRAIPEDNARTMALETGEISLNTTVLPLDKELLKSKGVEIFEFPSVTTEMMWFNNEKLSFEERIKISRAVNKKDILEVTLRGGGTIANSMIPLNSFGYIANENIDNENRENIKINRKLKIILNDVAARKTNAQIIQSNLKEVGIDAEIIIYDWAKYLDSSAKGEHDILLGGWVNGTLDAEGVLEPLFYSTITPAGGRRTMYSNEEFDRILDSSRTYDLEVREKKLKEAAKKIYIDYAVQPLYYANYIVGVREDIKGFKPDFRGLYDFSDLDVK